MSYPGHKLAVAAGVVACLVSLGCRARDQPQAPDAEDASMIFVIVDVAIEDPDCGDCGRRYAQAVLDVPGVLDAIWHPDLGEVTVTFDASVASADDLLAAGRAMGLRVARGDGTAPGRALAPLVDVPNARVVGDSEPIGDLAELAVSGAVTLVYFDASWCGPCAEVEAKVLELAATHAKLRLVRVEVSSWRSPVAEAHLADATGLPYLVLFDRARRRVTTIDTVEDPELTALEAALSAQLRGRPKAAEP